MTPFLLNKLDDLPPQIVPTVAGLLTFYSSLALSTTLQQRVLRISTGSIRPLPTVVGVASVAAASVVSYYSSAYVAERLDLRTHNRRFWRGLRRHYNEFELFRDMSPSGFGIGTNQTTFLSKQTLKIITIGLIAFKVFGGRFWGVAPSSFTHLGSFARVSLASLPATESYASSNQRIKIEKLGKLFGCHTCGSKMRFKPLLPVKFHGDHMPPKSVAAQMNRAWWRRLFSRKVSFRFYPQCTDCSNIQGSLLGKAAQVNHFFLLPTPSLAHVGGGINAYNHGFVPRLHHMTGALLGLASAYPDTWHAKMERRVLDEVKRFERWVGW